MLSLPFSWIVVWLVLSSFSSRIEGNHDESQAREISCSKDANARNEGAQRPKVAVIGCGPGGMFFLHALATKRKKLEEECDVEGLAAFPEVTVYEKASDPGGVWRPNTETERSGSVNMFGGLWSNSPSIDAEFFDYTFKDHFGGSVPLYLPRAHLLEYMMARVTSVEDIFQHVQFNTQVTWASYKKDTEKFVVETKNLDTEKETVAEFDKLVWAGGVQSELYVPQATHFRLTNGEFKGVIIHSAELVDIDSSIEGKRLLLVGDSYSAEDLTLQALKLNAEHVYITSANKRGEASSTSSWPGNKAESLKCLPTQVINNGTGLLCSEVHYDDNIGDYVPSDTGGESRELEDIAAVVYCTGYGTNMRYLEEDLQYACYSDEWSAPKGWKSQRNSLTRFVGNVEPAEVLSGSNYVCDNIYRHVQIDNPNMMYIHTRTAYYLPEIDAMAWAVAAYVTGETVLPTAEEMKMRNTLEKLDELHVPWHRYDTDLKYAAATMPLYNDVGHWLNTKNLTAGYGSYRAEYLSHVVRLIARDQEAGGHGGDWGSYDKLSERGEKLVSQLVEEYDAREFSIVEEETQWRTFRDIEPTPYESLYTGIKAAPLKGRWMELGDDGNILPHVQVETER